MVECLQPKLTMFCNDTPDCLHRDILDNLQEDMNACNVVHSALYTIHYAWLYIDIVLSISHPCIHRAIFLGRKTCGCSCSDQRVSFDPLAECLPC